MKTKGREAKARAFLKLAEELSGIEMRMRWEASGIVDFDVAKLALDVEHAKDNVFRLAQAIESGKVRLKGERQETPLFDGPFDFGVTPLLVGLTLAKAKVNPESDPFEQCYLVKCNHCGWTKPKGDPSPCPKKHVSGFSMVNRQDVLDQAGAVVIPPAEESSSFAEPETEPPTVEEIATGTFPEPEPLNDEQPFPHWEDHREETPAKTWRETPVGAMDITDEDRSLLFTLDIRTAGQLADRYRQGVKAGELGGIKVWAALNKVRRGTIDPNPTIEPAQVEETTPAGGPIVDDPRPIADNCRILYRDRDGREWRGLFLFMLGKYAKVRLDQDQEGRPFHAEARVFPGTLRREPLPADYLAAQERCEALYPRAEPSVEAEEKPARPARKSRMKTFTVHYKDPETHEETKVETFKAVSWEAARKSLVPDYGGGNKRLPDGRVVPIHHTDLAIYEVADTIKPKQEPALAGF